MLVIENLINNKIKSYNIENLDKTEKEYIAKSPKN